MFVVQLLLKLVCMIALHVCRAPDTAKIKAKMMYASTKDFFKGHLDGVSIELQANEHDEITEDAIGDSVKSVITRQ